MKAANPTLLALFATDKHFEQFDLYTFTLSSGLILRYANCPFDVVYNGTVWWCARSPGGIQIDEASDSGPRANWTTGFDVGSWEITVMPRPNDVIGVLPWVSAVRSGILQEATVRVDRGYVAAWPAIPSVSIVPAGLVNVFFGRVAEIDFGRSSVQININDPRELLDIDMPRNLYTAQCRYALFSPQCTVNKLAYSETVAVTNFGSTQIFTVAVGGLGDGSNNYFGLGSAQFVTGANAGLRLLVRESDPGGVIVLIAPMPFNIAIGDQVLLSAGCDKSTNHCTNKFGNLINYGGFTQIPAIETAV